MSAILAWIGDHLPGRFGNWLLRRFGEDMIEPSDGYDRRGGRLP